MKNSLSLAFFNEFSYCNDSRYIENQISRNITQNEIAGKDVLDFGCGAGCGAICFARYSPKSVLGIDVSTKNIAVARSRIDKSNSIIPQFIEANLDEYPLPESSYDVIWSDTVIEYVTIPFSILADRWSRALRTSGVLYASFIRDTFHNRLVFFVTRTLSFCIPKSIRPLFFYALLPKYWVSEFLFKSPRTNRQEIRNKINFLFTPFTRFYQTKEVEQQLVNHGFLICHVRERIKSDPNSPAHIEIKAIKQAV